MRGSSPIGHVFLAIIGIAGILAGLGNLVSGLSIGSSLGSALITSIFYFLIGAAFLYFGFGSLWADYSVRKEQKVVPESRKAEDTLASLTTQQLNNYIDGKPTGLSAADVDLIDKVSQDWLVGYAVIALGTITQEEFDKLDISHRRALERGIEERLKKRDMQKGNAY